MTYDTPNRGRLFDSNPTGGSLLRTLSELHDLDRYLGDGLIADIGAGTGRLAKPLSRLGARQVVAIDPAFAMVVEVSRSRDGDDHVLPVVGLSSEQLPFAPEVIDGAMSFGVFSRFETWREVISPIPAALRPGAPFVFNHKSDAQCQFWSGRPTSKGAFSPTTLSGELGQIGLRLEAMRPGPITIEAHMTGAWCGSVAPPAEAVQGTARWLDKTVAEMADPSAWTRVERELANALPLHASSTTIIVARRVGNTKAGAGETFQGEVASKSDAEAAVSAVFAEPWMRETLAEPACFRLLAGLEPLLDRVCNGKAIVEMSFPDRMAELEGVRRQFEKITNVRLLKRVAFRARQNWNVARRHVYRRLLST